jgi:ubiquitin-like modifier-activating enzyme ATG7
LYDRKIDIWKLNDTEKLCNAVVSNNSVYLDRSSLPLKNKESSHNENEQQPEDNQKYILSGIIRVFNTKRDLLKFHEENKHNLLQSTHDFIFIVHADLKQYSFDYFFAWPTAYPSAQFYARFENQDAQLISNLHPIPTFDYQIIRKRDCFLLPWIARNVIFQEYTKGTRLFGFRWEGNSGNNVNCAVMIECNNFHQVRYTGWSSATLTTVNLSQTMDPHLIAEQNAELNLKLMMWKHEPNLPLQKLRQIKCLLIGAGTIGCSVARLLIAWGLRDITFVDCANISPSNPVRQNLYTANDIGKEKASTAASTLTSILPSVTAKGYTLEIPMPGHKHFGTENDITELDKLIVSSDIIFLSTDSREGRWLPIALAKIHNKEIINIALNYESLLIQYIKEDNGCYFCTDPVGPVDSMTYRTIDEKCTITRPGISFVASSLAVEFFVDIIRGVAKHHIIRFNLSDMKFICDVTHKNPICSCCSVDILSELSGQKNQFVEDVKNEPSIIEDLSGYTEEYENWNSYPLDFENEDECASIDDGNTDPESIP